MALKELELPKKNKLLNEARGILEESKMMPFYTSSKIEALIKRIQDFHNKIKDKPEVISELEKIYPITDKNNKYNGTYFKILIEWCGMYNAIDKIKNSYKQQDISALKGTLDSIIAEMEKDYNNAIENSEGKRKKNMQIGLRNAEKFYQHGKIMTELVELSFKNTTIKDVLNRNPDVFWRSIEEKDNKRPVEAMNKAISELKAELDDIKEKQDKQTNAKEIEEIETAIKRLKEGIEIMK